MNYALLKYELEIKNVDSESVSKKLGISKSAWYRKLSGKSEFKRDEIQILINELNLDQEKAHSIFFETQVS